MLAEAPGIALFMDGPLEGKALPFIPAGRTVQMPYVESCGQGTHTHVGAHVYQCGPVIDAWWDGTGPIVRMAWDHSATSLRAPWSPEVQAEAAWWHRFWDDTDGDEDDD